MLGLGQCYMPGRCLGCLGCLSVREHGFESYLCSQPQLPADVHLWEAVSGSFSWERSEEAHALPEAHVSTRIYENNESQLVSTDPWGGTHPFSPSSSDSVALLMDIVCGEGSAWRVS